jgi:hypothetical protein
MFIRRISLALPAAALIAVALVLTSSPLSGASATTQPAAPAAGPVANIEYTYEVVAPMWQYGTAAQVVGYRYGDDRFLDGVLVFNGGSSTLNRVRISCVLRGTSEPGGDPQVLMGLLSSPLGVQIGPGQVGGVAPLPWTIDEVLEATKGAGLKDIEVILGIARADWDDGTAFKTKSGVHGCPACPHPGLHASLDAAYAAVTPAALDAAFEQIGLIATGARVNGRSAAASNRAFETTTVCVDRDGWMCMILIGTGECRGSARCPGFFPCSSFCKKVVITPPDL